MASLCQLDIPFAQIKAILALDAGAAAGQIAARWDQAEARHAARRDLAGYLIDRRNGKEPVMHVVQVRDVPVRSLLCLLRRVHGDEIMAMGKDLIARLHPAALPSPGDPVRAPFMIYHGEVSQDGRRPHAHREQDELEATYQEHILAVLAAGRGTAATQITASWLIIC